MHAEQNSNNLNMSTGKAALSLMNELVSSSQYLLRVIIPFFSGQSTDVIMWVSDVSERLNAFFPSQAFAVWEARNLQLMFVSHVSVDWWLKFCAGNWKVEGLNPVWVYSWAETLCP